MKYKIFKLSTPDILIKTYRDGYDLETIENITLQELDFSGYIMNDEHNSIESAMEEIRKHKNELENTDLTILPIIEIDYNGEIRGEEDEF